MSPATYESAAEKEVLLGYFRGRRGELENTVFRLLKPDGRPLTRGGRTPNSIFDDAADMASSMEDYAKSFKDKGIERSLPVIGDVRLGLNVAACDGMPLIVGLAKTAKKARELRAALA